MLLELATVNSTLGRLPDATNSGISLTTSGAATAMLAPADRAMHTATRSGLGRNGLLVFMWTSWACGTYCLK